MNTNAGYIRFTRLIMVSVFVVILAGGIVRTTQSGMGCPDWPTCFGYIIPPTAYNQVMFQPNHAYAKGQFIIYNDSLKYAREAFVSGPGYNTANWQQYEKHNYAKFEVYQTWIEYVNRLCTGLLGFLLIGHIIWSVKKFYKTQKSIVWLSAGLILLVVFEAWLGKVVVDTNLGLVQISAHFLPALALAAIPVIIINKLGTRPRVTSGAFKGLLLLAMAVTLAQIIIGTGVRAQIDTIAKGLGYSERALWTGQLNSQFTLHKIIGIALAAVCLLVTWRGLAYSGLQKNAVALLIIVLLSVASGLVMASLSIPAFVQPVHLLLSSILFILLLNLRLKVA
jgi:cytochrome c oxidase assembly protein subunit 15